MNPKVKHILSLIAVITSITCLLGYCIFALIYFHKPDQKVQCKSVSVCVMDSTEHGFVNAAMIYDHLAKQKLSPIGGMIGIEESHRIEKSIAKLSPIKVVHCYMGYNGNFHINLYQRCPIYRVLPSEGVSYYIDNDRRTMPISHLFTAYTPIVTGKITPDEAKGELYDFMVYLLSDDDWNALFTEVHIDEKHNIRLTSRQGIKYIELGKLNNYANKMEKLRAWYQQYPHKNDASVYKKITITYDELIFCTKINNHE
ncbi:MAG: hypothetical protein J6V62_05250 [Paludibacteraceae bacterium]|nr:hypothetical protein [Paludibacteraceae bacterium]